MKTFIQWLNEQEKPEGSPLAATNARTNKSIRNRDRLARMETMLQELVSLKQLVVDRRNEGAEK